jgi:hypothetical protein
MDDDKREKVEFADVIRVETADLTPEHKEYLMRRYGTLDLDPIPAPDDADPYNWPIRKVDDHISFDTGCDSC